MKIKKIFLVAFAKESSAEGYFFLIKMNAAISYMSVLIFITLIKDEAHVWFISLGKKLIPVITADYLVLSFLDL